MSGANTAPVSHTPGPWRWLNEETLVADHGRRRAILTAYGLQTCGEDGLLRPLATDEPNACLIAAAPELLQALREVAADCYILENLGDSVPICSFCSVPQGEPHEPECTMHFVLEAIAKAEGL